MMFFKLFKYDFRANARFGVPILIAIVAFGLIGCGNAAIAVGNLYGGLNFTKAFPDTMIFFSMAGLLLIGVALAAVATVMEVMLYVRFYKTTVSDEAYLTFMLPATNTQILLSKFVNTLLWSFMCIVALVVAGCAIMAVSLWAEGISEDITGDLLGVFADIFSQIGSGLTVFLLLLRCAVSAISSCTMIFMAITFGASVAKKHKAVCAIVMIFFVNTLTSLISGVMKTNIYGGVSFDNGVSFLNTYSVSCIVLHAALAVVYFLLTKYIMDENLNIE